MSFMFTGAGAPDYFPCRYGMSRSQFRGPARDLSGGYVAMLGGTQTFGKYVAAPFPTLVEEATRLTVANLGALNAGPEFYLSDPATLAVAHGARCAVVQMSGVETVSNRFYTVHSRRNDRFLAATPALRSLYPEVEFTDIHFTRHLLAHLRATGPDRFVEVARDLKSAWVARMQSLIGQLPPTCVLLWLAQTAPPDRATALQPGSCPLLIDRAMIDCLRPAVSAVIEVVPSAAARAEGVQGMQFPAAEQVCAQLLPGAALHREVAQALIPVLGQLVPK